MIKTMVGYRHIKYPIDFRNGKSIMKTGVIIECCENGKTSDGSEHYVIWSDGLAPVVVNKNMLVDMFSGLREYAPLLY